MAKWAICIWVLTGIWIFQVQWAAGQYDEDFINNTCKGVFIKYNVLAVEKIHPYLEPGDPDQPYSFEAQLLVVNMGFLQVKNWQVFVSYDHREWLVTVENAILVDDGEVPTPVGNGTIFRGFPETDLKNSVETAGEYKEIAVIVSITGSEFGAPFANQTVPKNITLLNEGWDCAQIANTNSTSMKLCCTENSTAANLTSSEFLQLEKGDLNILYDILQTSKTSYTAQVTISNDYALGRLDGWNLTWEWQRGEFINSMKGAETLVQYQSECLNNKAGVAYPEVDFSQVMNCEQKPTIVDLSPEKAYDPMGMVKYCCRNGVLLPFLMNPNKTKSAFKLEVFKIPPNNDDRLDLAPPTNFNIGPLYKCGLPRLVAPSQFPDPSSSERNLSAAKTWQVTCNLTSASSNKKCCVSFSAYYNNSIFPCKPCSCGCTDTVKQTCSANAEALLISPDTLLLPSANRTSKALKWAKLKQFPVPSTLPCSDYCGVSINWHVVSDFEDGWSARMTIFNWNPDTVANWFAAVELDKAMPGYEKVYTFNGTMVPDINNTLYMQGIPGYMDYLPGISKNDAGKVQSVISFKKAKTPNINISSWDGFPSRVFFNGDECVIPDTLPTSSGLKILPKTLTAFFFILLVFIF